MNRTKEDLLSVNKNRICYKIKAFFIKLFFPNKNRKITQEDKIQDTEVVHNVNKTNSFLKEIKVVENTEQKELFRLQKLFRMGKIQERDLSKEEKNELEKLYKKQIDELHKSIHIYQNKILSAQKKLKKNN